MMALGGPKKERTSTGSPHCQAHTTYISIWSLEIDLLMRLDRRRVAEFFSLLSRKHSSIIAPKWSGEVNSESWNDAGKRSVKWRMSSLVQV